MISRLRTGDWKAEVENDQDCDPQIFDAALEAEADGTLSLAGYYGYREDSPRYGVSLGQIVVQIDGVKFSVERIGEGTLDSWEVSGVEVEYDGGLTEDDLTSALEEGRLPHYDAEDYYLDESTVTAQDLIDVCDTYPEFLVETEGGNLLGFDDEGNIPDGAEPVEVEEVIKRLLDAGKVSFDIR